MKKIEIDIKMRKILYELNKYYSSISEDKDTIKNSMHIKIQEAITYLNIKFL